MTPILNRLSDWSEQLPGLATWRLCEHDLGVTFFKGQLFFGEMFSISQQHGLVVGCLFHVLEAGVDRLESVLLATGFTKKAASLHHVRPSSGLRT